MGIIINLLIIEIATMNFPIVIMTVDIRTTIRLMKTEIAMMSLQIATMIDFQIGMMRDIKTGMMIDIRVVTMTDIQTMIILAIEVIFPITKQIQMTPNQRQTVLFKKSHKK